MNASRLQNNILNINLNIEITSELLLELLDNSFYKTWICSLKYEYAKLKLIAA